MKPTSIVRLLCAALVLGPLAPVNASETVRIPLCSHDGVRYILMTVTDENDSQDNQTTACHRPFVCARRRAQLKTNHLGRDDDAVPGQAGDPALLFQRGERAA